MGIEIAARPAGPRERIGESRGGERKDEEGSNRWHGSERGVGGGALAEEERYKLEWGGGVPLSEGDWRLRAPTLGLSPVYQRARPLPVSPLAALGRFEPVEGSLERTVRCDLARAAFSGCARGGLERPGEEGEPLGVE